MLLELNALRTGVPLTQQRERSELWSRLSFHMTFSGCWIDQWLLD